MPPTPPTFQWANAVAQAIGLNQGLSLNPIPSRPKRASESNIDDLQKDSKRPNVHSAISRPSKAENPTYKRKKMTVYITKIDSKFLDNKKSLLDQLASEFKIKKEDVTTIKYTKAGNCMIEFENEESFNLISNKSASFCTDNGKVTPLNTSDQNNYIVIKGTTKEKMDQVENIANLLSNHGILSYENLAKPPASNNSMNHNGSSQPQLKLVKALCANSEAAFKLIKNGIVLDFERFSIKAFIPSSRLTVCYKCAQFNHHADSCSKKPRCYKCSEDHPSWECPSFNNGKNSSCSTNSTHSKSVFKCPGCNGDHPQTYAKCPTYQEALKQRHSKKPQPPTSYRIDSANPIPFNLATQSARSNLPRNSTTATLPHPMQPPTTSINNLVSAIELLTSKFSDLLEKIDLIQVTVQANTTTLSELTSRVELLEAANQETPSKTKRSKQVTTQPLNQSNNNMTRSNSNLNDKSTTLTNKHRQ